MNTSVLRWVTLVIFAGMIIVAVMMSNLAHWSKELQNKINSGLPDGLSKPVIFSELANNSADFRSVFATPVNLDDNKGMLASLDLDYVFIVTYTALLIVLGLRQWNLKIHRRLALCMLILPPVIACCDVMENLGITESLKSLSTTSQSDPSDAMVAATRHWSMTKWQLYFLDLLFIGFSFMGAEKWGHPTLPVLLRRLSALLLAAAAFVGFSGLVRPHLIETGFKTAFAAMIPFILLLLVFPDAALQSTKVGGSSAGNDSTV